MLCLIFLNKRFCCRVSSIAGYKGLPARTGYSASKFAMQGFLESLRLENLKKGLHADSLPWFTASNIRNTALDKDGTYKAKALEMKKNDVGKIYCQYIVRAVQKRQNSLILTLNGKLTVFLNKFFPKL